MTFLECGNQRGRVFWLAEPKNTSLLLHDASPFTCSAAYIWLEAQKAHSRSASGTYCRNGACFHTRHAILFHILTAGQLNTEQKKYGCKRIAETAISGGLFFALGGNRLIEGADKFVLFSQRKYRGYSCRQETIVRQIAGLKAGDRAGPHVDGLFRIGVQGIVLDTFHFYRSGNTVPDLAGLPENWFRYVHLCDAPAEIPAGDELVRTGLEERLIPGEGVIDIRGILRALPPVVRGVEIPHRIRMEEMGAENYLRDALQRTKEYLEGTPG